MACFFTDNLQTKSFTPREYQVELLETALGRNIIVCLDKPNCRTFITTKLIQELSTSVRQPWSKVKKRSLFLGEPETARHIALVLRHLTDLRVAEYYSIADCPNLKGNHVLVTTSHVCSHWVNTGRLKWAFINLLILEDSHNSIRDHALRKVVLSLKASRGDKPRVLGLTSPLFLNPSVEPGSVEAEVKHIENELGSNALTSSEIVSVLRYSAHPSEMIVECENYVGCSLSDELLTHVEAVEKFLEDHRYDPREIYEDEFSEELQDIPDPKLDPFQILNDFKTVLHTMGPYCADKAALLLLIHIEKLKVKTPYERHFLLLCMVSSALLKIRAICDNSFEDITEEDKILLYSSPKVLRLIEILRWFKPKTKVGSFEIEEERVKEEEEEASRSLPFPMPVMSPRYEDLVSPCRNLGGKICLCGRNGSCFCELHEKAPVLDDPPKIRRPPRRGWRSGRKVIGRSPHQDDADNLCGIIFVQERFTAKVLFHLLNDLRKFDGDFANISTQYTVGKIADPISDPRDAELEHRKQEDVLKRFRMRECNLVVATSVLEEGIELPRCNLVVRYDAVPNFRSYIQSKARARQQTSFYVAIIEAQLRSSFLQLYSKFLETEKMLLARSGNEDKKPNEESEAEHYTPLVPPFKPSEETDTVVSLSTAIALVNRYCAKLPSDTFTRLTPLSKVTPISFRGHNMFVCTLRLPINSPLKQEIIGHPMPNRTLARRIAALETCRALHQYGELDNSLEPIGKEAFNIGIEEDEEDTSLDPNMPRPGTTKSRQYYYKRIAKCLNHCRPKASFECFLYSINMALTCPLPEEQNTRGRKLHPPELAPQGFGILTTKIIPKVCPFPIFTRSGEVCVSLELCSSRVILTPRQVETTSVFLNYIFTSVLRLQKSLMNFDPEAEENSFFIVPTRRGEENDPPSVDWPFLEEVFERRGDTPKVLPEEERKGFCFDPAVYSDSVVMPWYRNQDQPQYFYVAEICTTLSPKSSFPGTDYKTFEDYYHTKYGIRVQNSTQPLLDVDHTSARLNFLTPRYVNRKGVALPTSSEETKRAKRENLEQKQILVPELCLVHLVPASLWRQAVCLPCILYRINALLIADEIRTTVAQEIALGLEELRDDFEWPALDFGWSLADVLSKSREEKESKPADVTLEAPLEESPIEVDEPKVEESKVFIEDVTEDGLDEEEEDEDDEKDSDGGKDAWMDIGTWSNEMAQLGEKLCKDLPEDLTMVRYGSPTSWEVGGEPHAYYSDPDSDSDSSDSDEASSVLSYASSTDDGLRITFKGDYLAEAVDDSDLTPPREAPRTDFNWSSEGLIPELNGAIQKEVERFKQESEMHLDWIYQSGIVVGAKDTFSVSKEEPIAEESIHPFLPSLPFEIKSYALPSDAILEVPKTEPFIPDDHSDASSIKCDDEKEEALFSFDEQPELEGHPGPSPALILQALTMSNANDGINLERLETIGDSFLKYAITTYLYCTYENIHEGKLSHMRSKQVSNLNLYRLGKKKVFGERMIASKFEPHDNWLPPCYLVPRDKEQALLDAEPTALLPYNLVTQHSIPDKSIADCVEALIGAYLIACGPRGALIFMSWLGIKVLPREERPAGGIEAPRPIGSTQPQIQPQVIYGNLDPPTSPLLRNVLSPEKDLERLMAGFGALERKLQYRFKDRSYLLQAMTHASYSPNRLTDCYQRLEFLGDAVLDYLITRHLYEDKRAHSPGALTDLRSALVNNTIFASLAVRHGLHKFFRHLSPGLGEVVERFVTIQEENSHTISEEYYLVGEEAEDVEVPKALGDVFESVAGAIFLDSSMSLDTVWRVYYRMMKKEIEQFSTKVPKSPIRELLELEPETAKFGKPEKLADGRRVRVTVEVFGKGTFKGIGRNYRIAKCTAAKCALKQLKRKGLLARKLSYFTPLPLHN